MKNVLFILILVSQLLAGQTVIPWIFQTGGDIHRFKVNLTNIQLNGQSFTSDTSDAIGIFEKVGDKMVCLGYSKNLVNGNDTLTIDATTATGLNFTPNSTWLLMYWDSAKACSRILIDTLSNKTLQNGGYTIINNLIMNDWSYGYSQDSALITAQDLLPIRSDTITPFRIYSTNSLLKLDSISGRIVATQSPVGSYLLYLVTTACTVTPKTFTFKIKAIQDSLIDVDTIPLVIMNQKCKNLGSIEVLSIPLGYSIDLIKVSNNITLLPSNDKFDSLSAGSYLLRFFNSTTNKYTSKFITIDNECKNPVLSFINNDNPEPVFVSDIGKCTIYNREGKLVKQFNAPFEWNGTDQGGSNLPTGDYIVFVNDVKYQTITIVR